MDLYFDDQQRLVNEDGEVWTCPECGAVADAFTSKAEAIHPVPQNRGAAMLLAHGIDPGPPGTVLKVFAWRRTLVCKNNHETEWIE